MSLARKITAAEKGTWHGTYGLIPSPGHSARDRGTKVIDHPHDPDDVIVTSFNGADWRQLKDSWRERGLLPRRKDSWAARRATARMLTPKLQDTDLSAAKRIAFALDLWGAAVGPAGTLVERYLRNRGLYLWPTAGDALRFHPSCPFGAGERRPCMVAIMRDVMTGEPKALHRTALTSDGMRIDRKMLGPVGGTAIMLTAKAEVTSRVGIAEGIETTLSVMQAGGAPVWALASAGAIERFPLLSNIAELVVYSDHDKTGLAAARAVANRWADHGRNTYVHIPSRSGDDFNDIVMEPESEPES